MLENIFKSKSKKEEFGGLRAIKNEDKYLVQEESLDSLETEVNDLRKDLKNKIEAKRANLLKIKSEKDAAFQKTEIYQEIAKQEGWKDDLITKQELEAIKNDDEEKAAMFKANKLDIAKNVREIYSENEVAAKYSLETARINKLLNELDNLEREISK